jgi:hypothetical protein
MHLAMRSRTGGSADMPRPHRRSAADHSSLRWRAPGGGRDYKGHPLSLVSGASEGVAEAYGNRTRRRRRAPTNGFEDQEGHQAPTTLHA